MEKIGEVFISHTHSDEEIAFALSDAIGSIFENLVVTSYSTKRELEGGIKPGEDWFRWIVDRVRHADIAVILLTPASVQKPWVLWEAGAVFGAGIPCPEVDQSKARPLERKVRPMIFKLTGSQVPSPFAGIQAVNGDMEADMHRFFENLIDDFQQHMEPIQIRKAAMALDKTVKKYLVNVQEALRDAPLMPTEAAVGEWCERLDDLTKLDRFSEVGYLHDWLNLTFGRGRGDVPRPLDIRLHRRLGDAYLAAKQWDKAIEEYKLALELAPRDIFLLRYLGKAYIENGRKDDASKVIDRIADLDKGAFSRNVECAALKGRLQKENKDLEGAVQTYRSALESNPESYYLIDVYGQTLLELDRIEDARGVYRRGREILGSLQEKNIWIYATMATASLVLNDPEGALTNLKHIADGKPSQGEIDSIVRGLKLIQKYLNLDTSAFNSWHAALVTRR
jgi:tetratricopeptide (TPR) repeat protein